MLNIGKIFIADKLASLALVNYWHLIFENNLSVLN